MCTLFPSSLFCAKNIFSFDACFSIVPQSYIHTQWCSFFHCYTILHTPCIILPLHLHIVALPCTLSYFCIFTLMVCSIVILHLHIPLLFINIIGMFFLLSLYWDVFTSLCFYLLCNFLFVHGNHYPLAKGLSPFNGSYFLSPYLHSCNIFLVVFVCFMVLLGLLQVVVFYYKHQRLVFLVFFLLFVATFFFLLLLLFFLFLLLISISNMTWFIYVDVVLCVGCVLYV